MAVSQGTINLFNLSQAALRELALDAGVKFPAQATKADYIASLDGIPRDQLERAAADLLYAGNTSVTWIRIGEGGGFSIDELRKAIVSLVGDDPFAGETRPSQVTHEPKAVEARVWDEAKVVLTFVVRKRVQTVIRNFEIEKVYADDFFQVIVRPDQGVFEVRASHARARLLERTWLTSLAEVMEKPIAYRLISVDEFSALRDELKGVLGAYKGRDAAGSIYDTRQWSKAQACPDLAAEKRFQEDTKGLEPVSADIVFTPEGESSPVHLKVSANGSIWFLTVVSEAVIDLVYDALRRIGAI